MEGTRSQKLTLKQRDPEREQPLEETEYSLKGFRNEKIEIVVDVTNGEKSKLYFE